MKKYLAAILPITLIGFAIAFPVKAQTVASPSTGQIAINLDKCECLRDNDYFEITAYDIPLNNLIGEDTINLALPNNVNDGAVTRIDPNSYLVITDIYISRIDEGKQNDVRFTIGEYEFAVQAARPLLRTRENDFLWQSSTGLRVGYSNFGTFGLAVTAFGFGDASDRYDVNISGFRRRK